ncbi:hypothetical protein CAEBREN_05182 [Caenorhabditis brenneri]|uniref:Serpentine Receptor, class Z n=1 Tax=Caenorhabditis brenneri TaxID=135651 RepID=G0NTL8_CAEBE|nr:hypothetical protein CAEBREN_05182 [Caenorhabditis brenneri]
MFNNTNVYNANSSNPASLFFQTFNTNIQLGTSFYHIILLIIFPLNRYIHNLNKERDKNIPEYPVIKTLYVSICVFYILFVLSCLVNFLLPAFLPISIFSFELYNIQLIVHLIILYLLAFRKFFVFFIPTMNMNFKAKHHKILLYFLYTIFVVKFFLVYYFVGKVYNTSDPKYGQWFTMVFNLEYITGYTLLTSATTLYIPIFLKIRKEGLPFCSNPDKYLMAQTFLLFFIKTMYLTHFAVCEFVGIQNLYSGNLSLYLFDYYAYQTVFAVQFSYVMCNWQQVLELRKKLVKKYLSCFAKVEPEPVLNGAKI